MGAIFSKVMTGNAPKRTRLREKICMDQDVVVHTRAASKPSRCPPASSGAFEPRAGSQCPQHRHLAAAPATAATATAALPPRCRRAVPPVGRRRRRPGSPQQTSPAQQRSQPRTSTPPAVALSTMHRVRALSSHLAPSVAAAEETVSREMGKTCTPSGPWHPLFVSLQIDRSKASVESSVPELTPHA
jgi:hypothetical protein